MITKDSIGKAAQIGLIATLAVGTWLLSVSINEHFYQKQSSDIRVDTVRANGRTYQFIKHREDSSR
jgi:hypothetical protein